MPVLNVNGRRVLYRPKAARGIGGGRWRWTRGARKGQVFRIGSGAEGVFHTYGKRRVLARNQPSAPSPQPPGGGFFQNMPTAWGYKPKALSAPAAPKPGQVAPKPPGQPGAVQLPDDAQAAAARAQALFNRNQQLSGLAQQGAYQQADFQEALRRMALQRPKDEQATKEAANRSGLFYSGQLGKQLGDVATSYAQREADQRQSFDRTQAAREAARQAILQGAPLEDAAITAELADRQLQRDTEAADAGTLAPEPQPAAPKKPSKPAKRRPKPKARSRPHRRPKPHRHRPRRRRGRSMSFDLRG